MACPDFLGGGIVFLVEIKIDADIFVRNIGLGLKPLEIEKQILDVYFGRYLVRLPILGEIGLDFLRGQLDVGVSRRLKNHILDGHLILEPLISLEGLGL